MSPVYRTCAVCGMLVNLDDDTHACQILSRVGCPLCPEKDKRIAELEAELAALKANSRNYWKLHAEKAEAELARVKAELQSAYAIGDVSHKDWEQAEAKAQMFRDYADSADRQCERERGLRERFEAECQRLEIALTLLEDVVPNDVENARKKARELEP